MARSTYVYMLVYTPRDRIDMDESRAFTVKHELVTLLSRMDAVNLYSYRVYRLRDGYDVGPEYLGFADKFLEKETTQ